MLKGLFTIISSIALFGTSIVSTEIENELLVDNQIKILKVEEGLNILNDKKSENNLCGTKDILWGYCSADGGCLIRNDCCEGFSNECPGHFILGLFYISLLILGIIIALLFLYEPYKLLKKQKEIIEAYRNQQINTERAIENV